MLCQDQDTTDKVVRVIDKHKLPRITVLTLNQMNPPQSNIRGNENECVLLKNFIQTKEPFMNTVLDSFTRNILLCKDVDIAEKWAKQGATCVTKDGTFINSSLAISGGS